MQIFAFSLFMDDADDEHVSMSPVLRDDLYDAHDGDHHGYCGHHHDRCDGGVHADRLHDANHGDDCYGLRDDVYHDRYCHDYCDFQYYYDDGRHAH